MTKTIFVFGSNMMGNHAGGAAAFAVKYHGAEMGKGFGPQGNSYAIPTLDWLMHTMAPSDILPHVEVFLQYAGAHPELSFEITRIGCGIAGLSDDDIAPLFRGAPSNCVLPGGWFDYDPDWTEDDAIRAAEHYALQIDLEGNASPIAGGALALRRLVQLVEEKERATRNKVPVEWAVLTRLEDYLRSLNRKKATEIANEFTAIAKAFNAGPEVMDTTMWTPEVED